MKAGVLALGLVGGGEVGHQAGHAHALGRRRRGGSTSASTSSGRAPRRPMPVSSFRCTATGRPAGRRRRRGARDRLGRPRRSRSAPSGRGLGPLVAGERAHHQQRRVDAGAAQRLGPRRPSRPPARSRRPPAPPGRPARRRGRSRRPSRPPSGGRRPAARTRVAALCRIAPRSIRASGPLGAHAAGSVRRRAAAPRCTSEAIVPSPWPVSSPARACSATAAAAAASGSMPLARQRGDDAGEHVAGPRGRERRRAVLGHDRRPAAGRARRPSRRPSAPPRPRSAAASSRAAASRSASTAARSRPSRRAASPACGVITVGAGRSREPLRLRRPGARGRPRRAPAAARSPRAGRRRPRRSPSARPRPGPSATAPTRPAWASAASTPAGVRWPAPPSGSGGAHHLEQLAGHERAAPPRAAATTVRPAPARSVARAARAGAPVSPVAPPITSTAPAPYFSESAPLRGIAAAGRVAREPRRRPRAATAGGMPMSATTTRPACRGPARPAGRPCRRGR